MIELPRRKFIAGLGALFAAPAIVRASSLMPVKAWTGAGPDYGHPSSDLARDAMDVVVTNGGWMVPGTTISMDGRIYRVISVAQLTGNTATLLLC